MRTWAIIILLLFCSCSSSWHLKQAERHIRKAQIKGASVNADTVFVKDTVFIKSVRVDSIFTVKVGDTVRIEKERLKLKYVRLAGDSVFIHAECEADTIVREIPVTVTKNITAKGLDWKWLLVALVAGFIVCLFMRR